MVVVLEGVAAAAATVPYRAVPEKPSHHPSHLSLLPFPFPSLDLFSFSLSHSLTHSLSIVFYFFLKPSRTHTHTHKLSTCSSIYTCIRYLHYVRSVFQGFDNKRRRPASRFFTSTQTHTLSLSLFPQSLLALHYSSLFFLSLSPKTVVHVRLLKPCCPLALSLSVVLTCTHMRDLVMQVV